MRRMQLGIAHQCCLLACGLPRTRRGGNRHRGLLQILLLGATGSLPSGYGENTYTICATHSEHCVQEQPQAGTQSKVLPSASIWYTNQMLHCLLDPHSNRFGLLLFTRSDSLGTSWYAASRVILCFYTSKCFLKSWSLWRVTLWPRRRFGKPCSHIAHGLDPKTSAVHRAQDDGLQRRLFPRFGRTRQLGHP
jgi:hypothetical protein